MKISEKTLNYLEKLDLIKVEIILPKMRKFNVKKIYGLSLPYIRKHHLKNNKAKQTNKKQAKINSIYINVFIAIYESKIQSLRTVV